jgi:hypothetical protein
LWNLVVCFVVLLSTLNPLGSLYESQSGCGPAFGFRPGIMKSLYYPNTVNITDLMIEPQKYCRVHELLVSLTGSEQILKNKLSSSVRYKDQPGSIGTCGSLTYSSNAIGYIGQIGKASWNDIVIRPVLVAMANSRNNRFYGWGGISLVGSLINSIFLMSDRGKDLNYCPVMSAGGLKSNLYGDLIRINGVEEYIINKGAAKDVYKYPETPVPISKRDVTELTDKLKIILNSSVWKITESELNASLYDLCTQDTCTFNVSTSDECTCEDNFNYCNLEKLEKCVLPYSQAINQLKRLGFVHERRTNQWISNTAPLTFNNFDMVTRSKVVSTSSILALIFWPFPEDFTKNLPSWLSNFLLPKSQLKKDAPLTVIELITLTFTQQQTYSNTRGGFWKLIK